jgi:hypothetical protein
VLASNTSEKEGNTVTHGTCACEDKRSHIIQLMLKQGA